MHSEIRGRTFFSGHRAEPLDAAREFKLCFRLKQASVPANAQLFGDVREQVPQLRGFLFVAQRLWKEGLTCGRVAWSADGETHLHVMRKALGEESESEWANELNEHLEAFMKADAKLSSSAHGMRRSRWLPSDLVLDHGQWRALHGDTGECLHELGRAMPTTLWSAQDTDMDPWHDVRSADLLRLHLRDCVFFYKFLPHQQEVLYPDLPFRTNDRALAQELRVSAATVPMPPASCRRSAWELLVERSAKLRSTANNYPQWALRQLACTLDGELAGYVAPLERALNEYTCAPLRIPWVQRHLSSFGTWTSYLLTCMEAYGFMYSQHLLCLKAFVGALDVYMEKRAGSLHYSLLLAGPAASSKSFVLTLLTRMLVPGTVSVATRRTANSGSYDMDAGAGFSVEHELTKEFFGSSKHRDSNPRGAQTKDVMTAHEFVTEALHMTDEGRRVPVISRSRCHRGIFAATNDYANGGQHTNDEALLTRFDVCFPSMGANACAQKDILSLLIREKDPKASDDIGFEQFTNFTRAIQKYVYWVLRAISVQALQDVDFSALHLVLSQLVHDQLRLKSLPARTTERICSLARVCTVITAIVEEFAFEHSPTQGGLPQMSDLPSLQPRLVCTAEIAKWCIEVMGHEIELPNQKVILQSLRNMTLVALEGDPNYLHPKQCRTVQAVSRAVFNDLGRESGVTPELVAQLLANLSSKQLVGAPSYRIAGLSESGPVVLDHNAPRKSAAAAVDHAIHAHVLLGDGSSRCSLEQALDKVARSAEHDEVRGAACAGLPHVMRTRARDVQRRPLNHVMRSGVFVREQDWSTLGVAQDASDVERCSQKRRIQVAVEEYAKRPRLLPPS